MADLRTEEEQIEALKNWWKENGRSTVLGIALAVIAVFGWRGWQDYQRNQAETASALYLNLQAATRVQPGEQLPEERRKTAEHLAKQLKTDFAGSSYAQFAALWLAKAAVAAEDLTTARNELNWVLEQQPEAGLAQVARQRLARVLAAAGESEQALSALGSAPLAGFEADYYEIRGDILLQQGKVDEARQAYQQGVDLSGEQPRPILGMKLEDLARGES